MEQKVFDFHYPVDCYGRMTSKLNEEFEPYRKEGWVIKQITSCSSCNFQNNQDSVTKVHVFLLAEKEK